MKKEAKEYFLDTKEAISLIERKLKKYSACATALSLIELYDKTPPQAILMLAETKLSDGSKVKCMETLSFEDGKLDVLSYAYEYYRPKGDETRQSVRYEKDPKNASAEHPLYHMHIGGDEPAKSPRHPTGKMSLPEFFKFVFLQMQ